MKKHMVFVEGKNTPNKMTPNKMHESREAALLEAQRLASSIPGRRVYVLEVKNTLVGGVCIKFLEDEA